MIERELVFLLLYTGVMVFFVFLTVKMWKKPERLRSDGEEFAVIASCFLWILYLLASLMTGLTPIHLWMNYLEAHGVLYSSGALK